MYNNEYIYVSYFSKNHHQNLVSTECRKNCYTWVEILIVVLRAQILLYYLCVAMAINIMHVMYYFSCLPNLIQYSTFVLGIYRTRMVLIFFNLEYYFVCRFHWLLYTVYEMRFVYTNLSEKLFIVMSVILSTNQICF